MTVRRHQRVSALLACALAAALPVPGAAAAPSASCNALDLSPDFQRDGTALCVGTAKERIDQPASGVNVFLSTDGGRSWQRRAGSGLTFTAKSAWYQVVFSAGFTEDRAIYVQDALTGIYRTIDNGASFTPVDPAAGGNDSLPNLARFPLPVVAPSGTSASGLAHAGDVPALLAPPARVPVTGSGPFEAKSFLIPRSFPDRQAYLVSLVRAKDVSTGLAHRVYECTVALTCTTEVANFPVGFRIHAAEVVASTQRLVVVGVGPSGAARGQVMAWRATADGKRLERYQSLEAILRPVGGSILGVGVTSLPSGELAVLVDHAGAQVRDVPARQLFVSARQGSRWTRVAFRRNGWQRGDRGTLPERDIYSATFNRSRLWVTPEGRLMALGGAGGHLVSTVFCSRDGRSWRPTC